MTRFSLTPYNLHTLGDTIEQLNAIFADSNGGLLPVVDSIASIDLKLPDWPDAEVGTVVFEDGWIGFQFNNE